jgi:hypothetical protein
VTLDQPESIRGCLARILQLFNQTAVISKTGLPDGFFSNQKSQIRANLEGLGMENVIIFYGHLEYFTAIWYYLCTFGIVRGHLVYFSVLVC